MWDIHECDERRLAKERRPNDRRAYERRPAFDENKFLTNCLTVAFDEIFRWRKFPAIQYPPMYILEEQLRDMKIESGFKSFNYATCMMCILEGDEKAQVQLRPYLPGSDMAWARSLCLLSPVPEILSVRNWLRNLLVIKKGFNLSFSFTCSCTRLQRSGEGHQGFNGIGSFSRLFVLQSNSGGWKTF